MGKKRKGLTPEAHAEIAKDVLIAKQAISRILKKTLEAYPVQHRVSGSRKPLKSLKTKDLFFTLS